jgi:hypothetical protein
MPLWCTVCVFLVRFSLAAFNHRGFSLSLRCHRISLTLPALLFFYCYYYDPVALPASGSSVSFRIRLLICIKSVCHSLPVSLAPPAHESCRMHHESSIVSLYTCTITFPFLSSLFLLSVIHGLAQWSRLRCHEPDEKCYITRTPNSILCLRLVVMR